MGQSLENIKNESHLIFLNGNLSNNGYIAIGCKKEIILSANNLDFDSLEDFISTPNEWKFGYISYDVKNGIEKLSSLNNDGLEFPEIHFFIPKTLIKTIGKDLELVYGDESLIPLLKQYFFNNDIESENSIQLNARIDKATYLEKINHIKNNIQQGNIYEMNFCYEYYNEKAEIDPIQTYKKLNSLTNAPFSCYGRLNDKYILSASPERYIKKDGNKIISQPIKGTISRGKNDVEDEQLKQQLQNDEKERSENIMIVDLVRNDLSKIAEKNSVSVEELCEIYSFETVHQMISTVSCSLKNKVRFTDIIKSTFPMGSMTGAPKIKSMELIEKYENTKRGVYSGCVGYVKPDGDFDFNVIIRTLLYNSSKKYLSCMVGGAITIKSIPENEYEETLLKASALLKALE